MPQEKSYQLNDLVLLFLVFTVLQLITTFITHKILVLHDLIWLQSSLVTCLTLSLIIYWQLATKELSLKVYFTNPSFSGGQLIGLLLASFGLSIILSEVNNIVQSFFPLSKTVIKQINNLIAAKSNSFIPGLLLIITAAGLKEIFFRGLIFQGLLTNYSLKKAAGFTILLQVVLESSLYHFIGIFTLSLLLNWLYLKSRSLLLCVFANIFYAAIPYFFLYYLPYKIPGYNTKLTITAQFQPFWFNLLGLLLLGGGAFLIINNLSSYLKT